MHLIFVSKTFVGHLLLVVKLLLFGEVAVMQSIVQLVSKMDVPALQASVSSLFFLSFNVLCIPTSSFSLLNAYHCCINYVIRVPASSLPAHRNQRKPKSLPSLFYLASSSKGPPKEPPASLPAGLRNQLDTISGLLRSDNLADSKASLQKSYESLLAVSLAILLSRKNLFGTSCPQFLAIFCVCVCVCVTLFWYVLGVRRSADQATCCVHVRY